MNQTTEELMELVQQGDALAFDFLYARLCQSLETYFRQNLRDVCDVEDMVQATIMKVWTSRNQYSPRRGLVIHWAKQIARNVLIDHFRRINRKRRRLPSESQHRSLEEPSIEYDDPVLLEEIRKEVRRAVNELPTRERSVCKMRLEGLSERKAAARLQMGVSAYSWRLSGARQSLSDDPILAELIGD